MLIQPFYSLPKFDYLRQNKANTSLKTDIRRKLFEKNKSVPTPIARFGESVTPAMIAKSANKQPAQSVNTEAWKRKRELSPSKIAPQVK